MKTKLFITAAAIFMATATFLACSSDGDNSGNPASIGISSSDGFSSSSDYGVSSSSSDYDLPPGMVLCLYNGVCAPIDPEICLAIPAEVVNSEDCPIIF
jgi:hypothetical protein